MRSSVLATLILVIACANDTPVVRPTLERDSAGILIVENSAPALPADSAWSLSSQPVLEIGTDDADSAQTLFRVAAAVRLAKGNIVIASGAAPMLRWYDESGRYLYGTGRPGEGPGEFSGEGGFIAALWLMAEDSVATWDLLQRRMQVFDAEGQYARSVTLERSGRDHRFDLPAIAGRLANGVLIMATVLASEPAAGAPVTRDSFTYTRWSPAGEPMGTLARLPGTVRYATAFWRAHVIGVAPSGDSPPPPPPPPPPFAPRTVAWASGERFYYGSGDLYEIEVHDGTGTLTTLVRAALPRRAVTGAMIEAVNAELSERLPAGPLRAGYAELFDQSPYPNSLPPYDGLLVDREGALWVRDYYAPGDTVTVWRVFDDRYRWLTTLQIAGELDVRDIGRDYLIALVRDSLDVERLRMYALRRH